MLVWSLYMIFGLGGLDEVANGLIATASGACYVLMSDLTLALK